MPPPEQQITSRPASGPSSATRLKVTGEGAGLVLEQSALPIPTCGEQADSQHQYAGQPDSAHQPGEPTGRQARASTSRGAEAVPQSQVLHDVEHSGEADQVTTYAGDSQPAGSTQEPHVFVSPVGRIDIGNDEETVHQQRQAAGNHAVDRRPGQVPDRIPHRLLHQQEYDRHRQRPYEGATPADLLDRGVALGPLRLPKHRTMMASI
jgi:hypothetical protein